MEKVKAWRRKAQHTHRGGEGGLVAWPRRVGRSHLFGGASTQRTHGPRIARRRSAQVRCAQWAGAQTVGRGTGGKGAETRRRAGTRRRARAGRGLGRGEWGGSDQAQAGRAGRLAAGEAPASSLSFRIACDPGMNVLHPGLDGRLVLPREGSFEV